VCEARQHQLSRDRLVVAPSSKQEPGPPTSRRENLEILHDSSRFFFQGKTFMCYRECPSLAYN
jgi:hypothetical protein